MGIMEYFSRKKANKLTYEQLTEYLRTHYFAKAKSLLNGNVSFVNDTWVDELAQTVISKGKEIQLATRRYEKNDLFEELYVLLTREEEKYDSSFEQHYTSYYKDAIDKIGKQKHLSEAARNNLLTHVEETHKEVGVYKDGLDKKMGAMHVTLYAARLSGTPEQQTK